MGVELFGADNAIYFTIACFTAYYFSGHTGIYSAQRLGYSKLTAEPAADSELTLQKIRKARLAHKKRHFKP